MEQAQPRKDAVYMSYEDFGRRFFEYAVSQERVAEAFTELAGSTVDFGPIGAGPGRLAKVTAKVLLATPELNRESGDLISFELIVPLVVDLLVDLAVDRHRFVVDGAVHLRLTARAAQPLRVVIDVDPPRTRDVRINVASESLRGALLRILVSVDHEIKRFVARYVARELDKPHIRAARDIDLAARIDAAWAMQGL